MVYIEKPSDSNRNSHIDQKGKRAREEKGNRIKIETKNEMNEKKENKRNIMCSIRPKKEP